MITGTTTAHAAGPGGRFDRPLDGFTAVRRLVSGKAADLGLDADALDRGWDEVVGFTEPPEGAEFPLYPGAVLCYGHQGRIVTLRATGFSRRYADAETDLPRSEWIETATDTIYDLASVSKLFTSIITMQLIEAGEVDLDALVTEYLPEFGVNGKESVTILMLLTHTSGFTSWLPLYSAYPDKPARIQAVMDASLINEPGSTYLYSDLNLITLGVIAEKLTGMGLDELVAARITEPLGMSDTGYNPSADVRDRVAATEYQAVPDRGMVWGEVHDENAWSLEGVAGHAGVFSTASDLAKLAQAMLNGGTYDGERILSEDSVEQLITNYTTDFPGDDHGLGFELNQRWYMGGLSSARTAGHTGYTGTSLVIDYLSGSFAILLTNRVHPSRSWGSVNPARIAAANGLADALRVLPVSGRSLWMADETPESSSTLELGVPEGARVLDFSMLIDVESTDPFELSVSVDGGQEWETLNFRWRGRTVDEPLGESGTRTWSRAQAKLPSGDDVVVRWSQTRDALYDGRGLFVDAIKVRDGRGRVVVDAERDPDELTADGWQLVRPR